MMNSNRTLLDGMAGPMISTNDDKEVGRLVVGVPGLAGAEIPVRTTLLARFVRSFRRAAAEHSSRVAAVRAHVYVPEDDNGRADVYLKLVNVGRQPLKVENLSLQQFSAGGGDEMVHSRVGTCHGLLSAARPRRSAHTRLAKKTSWNAPSAKAAKLVHWPRSRVPSRNWKPSVWW